MTIEQELKLHVQEPSRQAVKDIVNTPAAKTIHLHAFYFDTCTRELAQAGIALRLRNEQGSWIQTLKLPSYDALSKIEYNHPRPEASLDLSVYAGTPAEQACQQLKNALTTRFETDIYRTLRLEETPHGVLELAYDEGLIRANALKIPVCELELELKEGASAAIFTAAKAWQQQHQFILDFRSKAERGDALASAALESTALDSNFTLWQPWQIKASELVTLSKEQTIQHYLEQSARNAAIITGIDRSDMESEVSLSLNQHINLLCSALQHLQELLASASDQAQQEPLLSALAYYEKEFATASPEKAKLLACSIAFQASLLDILARTVLKP